MTGEIASYAADICQSLLKKLGAEWNWFTLRYKYPSKSTIRNVLTRIDAAELDRITGARLSAQARKDGKGEWEIALDGKVMRGAWTDENDKVTLFSAMLHREAITIAQVRVPEGTNEITQADTLLDTAKVPEGESVLVTLDAAHTQRETAETICGKPGWDYLMTVKGNQPSLQRAVLTEFSRCSPEPRTTSWKNTAADASRSGHAGSPTQRESISRTPPRPPSSAVRYSKISGDRISKERALILTSRESGKMTAADANRHTRGHWGIENKSHYIRDTLYREDQGQAWAGETARMPSPRFAILRSGYSA